MRTTVVLRDEAYELARIRAFKRRQSLGDAISDLILSHAHRDPVVQEPNDLGFLTVRLGEMLTVERPKELSEEE